MRVYVVVEGDTELAFVKTTLVPHLAARSVWMTPIEVTTKRDRMTGKKLGRGGGHWKHWKRDIERLTKVEQGDVRVTSLFDLYGLPDDFPELAIHQAEPNTLTRAGRLEAAMAAVINDHRFIPYLQRHEFEALVLAARGSLASLLPDKADRDGLEHLGKAIAGLAPEDINDGAGTAPSKRLLTFIPGYRKATLGPSALQAFGLLKLREACPRFDAWVSKLEGLESK